MNLEKVEPDLLALAIEKEFRGPVPMVLLIESCSLENFINLRFAGFTMTFPFPVGELVGGYASLKNLEALNDLDCVLSLDLMHEKVVPA